ncbi:MAG: hypothetical protein GC146_14135 [Limimaricola sp.]|uniref:hypothetical protein n=1 Tax=Limimaricola sp. TaxID=2211665 RepID=UPI001DD8A3A5|nr:hypothetical protein [Limimaricola sp.]MBI1418356.1 hypothetical protein [Limimaricola sp.]
MTNAPLTCKPQGARRQTTGLVAALAALTLSACSGGMLPLATPAGSQKIEVLGDTFFVTQNGNTAVVKNFATGTDNQQRLLFNAQMAAIRATNCAIHTITQRDGVNTYDVTLTCPTSSQPRS